MIYLRKYFGSAGHTKDFRDVQPRVGSMTEFDSIVKAAKKRDQRVVLELDPNHSSLDHPWFQRSVKREDPYTNYYVWADQRTEGSSGIRKPPNNWVIFIYLFTS